MNPRFSIRRFLTSTPLWFLAGILLSAAWCRADEPPHRRMENRFLFVVDTSSAMKVRAKGVEEAVNALMESGMNGELRRGDTIGLWTYNDHLDTDFPMEVWSEEKKDSILREVRAHLNHVRYEKHAHLDKALPAVLQVAENSERLTIILIFDGSDPIKGTTFDKDINELHKHFVREFRAASEPFVTVMAWRNGALFDYTINYPATVVLPHTADPLPPPETNAPPIVAVTPPPPEPPPPATPTTNVQIILSGADFAPKVSAPPHVTTPATFVPATPIPAPTVATNVSPPIETKSVAAQAAPTNAAPAELQRTPPLVVSTAPPAPITTKPPKPVVVEPAPPPASVPVATPATKTPVPITPAVVVATTGQLTAMFVIAFSLLTMAIVLVLFLVRRWRGGGPPSLISQSIDRPR